MTEFSPPEWLDVPDGRLAFERKGSGAPIIFLHAGIVDRRVWDREFHARSASAQVVRYDRRGFGQSPPGLTSFSEIDDLAALFRHLALGPAVLVGNSMGGGLAIDYALEHPADVRGLLLIAPSLSGWTPQRDPEGQATYDRDFARSAGISAAWKAGRREEALELLRAYWASGCEGAARAAVERMLRDNVEEAFTERSGSNARPIDPPAVDRLGSIAVPSIVLLGDRDEPTMEFIDRRIARGIPGATFVPVRGGDHLINLSRPEAFDRGLDEVQARAASR